MTRFRIKDFSLCGNEKSGTMVRCTLAVAEDDTPILEVYGWLFLKDRSGRLCLKPPMTQTSQYRRVRFAKINPEYEQKFVELFKKSRPGLVKKIGKEKTMQQKMLGELSLLEKQPVGDEFGEIPNPTVEESDAT